MRQILFISLLIVSFAVSLNAQLRNEKFLTLKGNAFNKYVTTSSEELLIKYKDIPDLWVQINESYEYKDLQIFSEVPNLKHLMITHDSMTSVNGLEQLKELERFSIYSNSIQDFSALKQIDQIKHFSIISNVTFDGNLNLPKLEALTYTCNYNLANCSFPKLKHIAIMQAVEHNLHYDDKNYGVEYVLQKPSHPIELLHFDSLRSILISQMQIKNLDDISFPKNLNQLNISDCMYLENVDQIRNLKSLEYLNISFCNQIENFEFLQELEDVELIIWYQGRRYTNENIEQLLSHSDEKYYYADYTELDLEGDEFYNFHHTVVEGAKEVFGKYHQQILKTKPTRKEFLELIVPIIAELDELCTEDTCNIMWDDEETDYLISFLKDMAQLANHEFDEGHLWRQFENSH